MEEIVRVRNLDKSFGNFQALNDVKFSVYAGEVVGFIGPNGAGKSTTIRTLLGMIQRDNGEVSIFGKDAWDDSLEIHKRISYLPGDVALWDNLTGGEIIDVLLSLHGGGNHVKKDQLLKRFDLDPRKKAKTYSKGNRQKVGLIAALCTDSDLYVFDEPTSGLDPLMEAVFQEEIEVLKQQGKAIFLSSHILSEVERLADRVVIIRQGRIVEDGSLKELKHITRSTMKLKLETNTEDISKLSGIYDFRVEGEIAYFTVDHDALNDLMTFAVKNGIEMMETNAPTLESLFMQHYE